MIQFWLKSESNLDKTSIENIWMHKNVTLYRSYTTHLVMINILSFCNNLSCVTSIRSDSLETNGNGTTGKDINFDISSVFDLSHSW
jgi:hypothetical protein